MRHSATLIIYNYTGLPKARIVGRRGLPKELAEAYSFQWSQSLHPDGSVFAALQKSIRNLAGLDFLATQGLNVYDILGHEYLVLTADSARKLEEALS